MGRVLHIIVTAILVLLVGGLTYDNLTQNKKIELLRQGYNDLDLQNAQLFNFFREHDGQLYFLTETAAQMNMYQLVCLKDKELTPEEVITLYIQYKPLIDRIFLDHYNEDYTMKMAVQEFLSRF